MTRATNAKALGKGKIVGEELIHTGPDPEGGKDNFRHRLLHEVNVYHFYLFFFYFLLILNINLVKIDDQNRFIF